MSVGESQIYTCIGGKEPSEVPAIDYMMHHLDKSNETLRSNEVFADQYNIPESAQKYIESIMRTVYRFLVFAYFNHNETWKAFEEKTWLTTRFTLLAQKYEMVADELLVIPPE